APALAAAAGVNLRFDDDRAAAEAARDLARFGGRECHLSARHRNAVTRENRLGLVFVDSHGINKLLMLACGRAQGNSTLQRHMAAHTTRLMSRFRGAISHLFWTTGWRFIGPFVNYAFLSGLILKTNDFNTVQWLGKPILQNMIDLWTIQETIYEVK